MPELVDVFISYAAEDEVLREELEAHLALLKRDGIIRAWHSRLIAAGADWRRETDARLRSARVVVLLVSASYLASDFLYDQEMTPTLARAAKGEALAIPVLVRAHDWQKAPFSGLTPLPRDKRPVTSWANRDEAWTDVATGLREAIEALSGGPASRPAAKALPPPEPRYEDDASRALAKQLDRAHARRKALLGAKAPTAAVDAEILDLRRRLREGGRLRPGDVLGDGRYLLLDLIGKGGFASVWSAVDREGGEAVAIKVLHPEMARDASRRERFFRGARVMAGLGHEAVVRVLSPHGEDAGWLYFVMEVIPGGDLHRAVLEGRMAREQVMPTLLGVGEALAEAHAKGIVHRDVKPANILLDADGSPRLTDFDLAAAGDTTGGTRTGAAMGTYLYMAPEQISDARSADARADVYGLGMTAMFCFHGNELPDTTLRRPEDVIDGLECGLAVKAVLKKAIALKPAGRFVDSRAFCNALREAATKPSNVLVVSEQDIARAHVVDPRRRVAPVALAVGATLALIFWGVLQEIKKVRPAAPERDTAAIAIATESPSPAPALIKQADPSGNAVTAAGTGSPATTNSALVDLTTAPGGHGAGPPEPMDTALSPSHTKSDARFDTKPEKPIDVMPSELEADTALALARASVDAQDQCKYPDGPTGTAYVKITVARSGMVGSVTIDAAFNGTSAGNCIISKFRSAHIPALHGKPISLTWKVTLK